MALSRHPVFALLLVAACGGDDASSVVDGSVHGDAPLWDAALPDCDHTEVDDDANDRDAEATGLTAGDEPLTICGQLDARAPGGDGRVDVDRYTFSVADEGDFLIRVDSANGRDVALLTAGVGLAAGGPEADRGHGQWVGNHLVFFASLEAGELVVDVVAFDDATPAESIEYALRLVPDDGAARCPPGAEPTSYVEAADGTGHRDNDMATVVYDPAFAISATASTTDAPEPSASRATVTAGMRYKLGGVAGDVTSPGDEYRDRDTYLIATGADTNELTVRVVAPAGGADLDFFVMPVAIENADPVSIWDGTQVGTTGIEVQTGAVLPSTSYWLWIGGYDDTGVVWPTSYVIYLCGESY